MNGVYNMTIQVGGGSAPDIKNITAKTANFWIRTGGSNLAILNGGSALSTVLDITEKGVIDMLALGNNNGANVLTLPKVKITVNGEVKFDAAISVSAYKSVFFIGSGYAVQYQTSGNGASIIGSRVAFNSLKVEIDSTGETDQTVLYGNPELT